MRRMKSALPLRCSSGEKWDEGGKVAAEARLWAFRVLFRRAEHRVPLSGHLLLTTSPRVKALGCSV